MATFIHKITRDRGQYRVTLPKDLVEKLRLEKAKVVEIWATESRIIHIREYNAKNKKR